MSTKLRSVIIPRIFNYGVGRWFAIFQAPGANANQDTETRKFRYGPYCAAYGFSGRRIPKELSVDQIVELIKPTFTLQEIASLFKHIGVKDDELVNELTRNQKEFAGWGVPYNVVGDPIAELTLKAFYGEEY